MSQPQYLIGIDVKRDVSSGEKIYTAQHYKCDNGIKLLDENKTQKNAEQAVKLVDVNRADTPVETDAARLAAIDKARLEGEEAARSAAIEKERLEGEEAARLEAIEKARIEAEEAARLAAIEKAPIEAEEAARLAAIEKARLEAEEAAKLAAIEKAPIKAEEAANTTEQVDNAAQLDKGIQNANNIKEIENILTKFQEDETKSAFLKGINLQLLSKFKELNNNKNKIEDIKTELLKVIDNKKTKTKFEKSINSTKATEGGKKKSRRYNKSNKRRKRKTTKRRQRR